MPTLCTRCEGTGFLNIHQIDLDVDIFDKEAVLSWIATHGNHDVQVCDCCGNGEEWYGTPGQHYNSYDPIGMNGPYAYNGGICECHWPP